MLNESKDIFPKWNSLLKNLILLLIWYKICLQLLSAQFLLKDKTIYLYFMWNNKESYVTLRN